MLIQGLFSTSHPAHTSTLKELRHTLWHSYVDWLLKMKDTSISYFEGCNPDLHVQLPAQIHRRARHLGWNICCELANHHQLPSSSRLLMYLPIPTEFLLQETWSLWNSVANFSTQTNAKNPSLPWYLFQWCLHQMLIWRLHGNVEKSCNQWVTY